MEGIEMSERYQNYINGSWTDGSSGDVSTSTNPADLSDVVGEFQASTVTDADAAITAAHNVKESWRRTSGLARGGYLLKAASYLEARYELAVTADGDDAAEG